MNYAAIATTTVASSDGSDIVRIVMTVIVLLVVGLAFPAAQAWAAGHTDDEDDEGQGSRREMLSLQPQWVLRQGKRVIESFDDEAEAARAFTRRITTKTKVTTP